MYDFPKVASEFFRETSAVRAAEVSARSEFKFYRKMWQILLGTHGIKVVPRIFSVL